MKIYQIPECVVILVDETDVIRTSPGGGENEGPFQGWE